jgi:hypothetical protein
VVRVGQLTFEELYTCLSRICAVACIGHSLIETGHMVLDLHTVISAHGDGKKRAVIGHSEPPCSGQECSAQDSGLRQCPTAMAKTGDVCRSQLALD